MTKRRHPALFSSLSWTRLAQASMAVAVVAFFLPWVSIAPGKSQKNKKADRQASEEWRPKGTARDSKPLLNPQMRKHLKGLGAGLKSIPGSVVNMTRMSGWQIPRTANSEAAKTAVQLADVLQRNKKPENIGLKSYAVYLLPGVHLLLGGLLLRWDRWRWVTIAVGLISVAVPIIGGWQIVQATAQAKGLLRIEYGLWLSLLAYWGLAAAAGKSALDKSARALYTPR